VTDTAIIDVLLGTYKTLAGRPAWVLDERGTVAKLAVPVLQNGVVAGLTLQAHATVQTNPQRGGCVLILEGRPIQRLSFRPDHLHVNPLVKTIPRSLRGLRLPANASRFHAWTLNREWPRRALDKVAVAEPVEPEPDSFLDALTIFLHHCGIEGALPPPPWEPRLL